MKTPLVLAGMLMATVCQADITLGGPGVAPGTVKATAVPFKTSLLLPGGYKFVFKGIEVRGNTAGGNGKGNAYSGQFHVAATVIGDTKVRSGMLEFSDVGVFNTSSIQKLLITPEAVYRATTAPMTIEMEWKGEGNAKKPDGTFNIMGEYQKFPPPPTGSLKFAAGDYVNSAAAAHPSAEVKISRE